LPHEASCASAEYTVAISSICLYACFCIAFVSILLERLNSNGPNW